MTDLEGSTAHLRALGDDYAGVLAQHQDIIRGTLAKEDGLEVGSEGDSFAAVLPEQLRVEAEDARQQEPAGYRDRCLRSGPGCAERRSSTS